MVYHEDPIHTDCISFNLECRWNRIVYHIRWIIIIDEFRPHRTTFIHSNESLALTELIMFILLARRVGSAGDGAGEWGG